MKIIVIGGTGTIGKAIVAELAQRHDVITAASHSGQYQVDMADIAQVRSLFDKVGKVDAVVVAAGKLHLGPLADMTSELFFIGINSKVMGQVNVAQVAQHYVNDGGSITLTSGIVGTQDRQLRGGASAAMVNNAVEGYARGAAIELTRRLRINVVSPTLLDESVEAIGSYFRGWDTVPASRVARAYSRSVEGAQTGHVFRVWQ
jgi:NAD(P)-dependent dehydrogenase (short-subunit alcohol dehydrogenase family)